MRLLKPVALSALLGAFSPAALAAQVPSSLKQSSPASPTSLTLDEAISLARQNNPLYLTVANERKTADAQVRAAYGALLPSSNAQFYSGYQQGGQIFVQGGSLAVGSDQLQSQYFLGLNYRINAGTLVQPRAAKASRIAADADIVGTSETMRSLVTEQYITALGAEANGALQDTLVQVQQANLELAKARVAVGADNILAVRRAEVTLGQAEVAALTAHNTAEVEKVKLFQQIGVQPPSGGVQLTTTFTIAKPSFSLDSVLDLARRVNPAVHALRERERSAGWNVRVAQSNYTPTLSLSTGWSGTSFQYTNSDFPVQQVMLSNQRGLSSCLSQDSIRTALNMASLNCNNGRFALTTDQAAQIRSENSQFPFKFQRAPLAFSATLSIPIFDNFNREQRVEQAQVDRDNARLNVRSRELQMTADVTQGYLNLVTAARTVEMQEVNAQKAAEELTYAQERYRVGATTFLDVTTAVGTYVQARTDRINAIYAYHRAFAVLEDAVGRPLR
ncbi:MAG TPA: TolC family protein [Gemmatimonadaceae bacterium]|jgi:outer membrane protein